MTVPEIWPGQDRRKKKKKKEKKEKRKKNELGNPIKHPLRGLLIIIIIIIMIIIIIIIIIITRQVLGRAVCDRGAIPRTLVKSNVVRSRLIILINETGSRSPCMRPRSNPPNFGPIERGEKQTNNID